MKFPWCPMHQGINFFAGELNSGLVSLSNKENGTISRLVALAWMSRLLLHPGKLLPLPRAFRQGENSHLIFSGFLSLHLRRVEFTLSRLAFCHFLLLASRAVRLRKYASLLYIFHLLRACALWNSRRNTSEKGRLRSSCIFCSGMRLPPSPPLSLKVGSPPMRSLISFWSSPTLFWVAIHSLR